MNIKQIIAVAAALAITTSSHAGMSEDGKCSKASCSKKEMSADKEASCAKDAKAAEGKEANCSKMEGAASDAQASCSKMEQKDASCSKK